MARNGPLLTLLGGGVLAGVLWIAGTVAAADQQDADGEPVAAGATPTSTPAATPAATPPPTAEPADPAPAEQQPVTYVGYVDGGGASVAVVITGDEATAYVCDGRTEAWLHGTAAGGELDLSGEDGELVGDYDRDTARGEAIADGQSWTFTIEQVAPPEGLYRVADTVLGGAEVVGGWIVLPDGTQVGVLTVDGEAGRAPALDPATGEVTVDGGTVTAGRVGGEETE